MVIEAATPAVPANFFTIRRMLNVKIDLVTEFAWISVTDNLMIDIEIFGHLILILCHVKSAAHWYFKIAQPDLSDPFRSRHPAGCKAKVDSRSTECPDHFFIGQNSSDEPARYPGNMIVSVPAQWIQRGSPFGKIFPARTPNIDIDSLLDQRTDETRPFAISLADKTGIVTLDLWVRTIDVRVRSFLAIDWIRVGAPIIFKPELFGDKAEVVFRGDFSDQMKLVRSITEPVDCRDASRTNLADYARLDTSVIEIAEKKIDGLLRMDLSHLRKQRITEPGTIPADKFALNGIGRVEVLKSAIEVVFEIDDLVSQFDKRTAQILAPKFRPELAIR